MAQVRSMAASRIAMAVLLLALGSSTSCVVVLGRGGSDARQPRGDEQLATTNHARGKASKRPRRSLVRTVSSNAAGGLVEGALDAVEEPQRRERLRQLGDTLQARVGATAKTAGDGLVEGIEAGLPETRPVLVELLRGVGEELDFDPERAGRKLARGAMNEMHVGITNLRPEVHRLVEDDVVGVVRSAFADAFGPGLEQRVRRNVKPAIDELGVPALAEDVGKKAALGFSAGMAEALAEDGSLGTVIDGRLEKARARAGEAKQAVDEWLTRGLLLALVVAVIVLVLVGFWWLRERGERVEAERARKLAAADGERLERMLRLVTRAIERAGARDELSAFREEIKRLTQQEGERDTAAALSHFLVREGLKLGKPRA
jgi:hypothetical protein